MVNKSGEEVVNKLPNKSQIAIIQELRNNPNINIAELVIETGLWHSAIHILNKMQKISIIERIVLRKKGYWKVNKY